jgi:XTP/dITP diphosphohydrolase
MPKLLLATSNPGKIREYRLLLDGLGYLITTPPEEGIAEVIAESGSTYEQNAQLKAVVYARSSRLTTLADDSGLEVDALNGEPGIQSARFAGEAATDTEKVSLLLTKLQGVPWERRTACFKCVIAIVGPRGRAEICRGECHGMIAFEPKGKNGFGYDPLPAEIKNQISHRARASQKARQVLHQLRI